MVHQRFSIWHRARQLRCKAVSTASPAHEQGGLCPPMRVGICSLGAVKIRMCLRSTLACRSYDSSESRVTPNGSNLRCSATCGLRHPILAIAAVRLTSHQQEQMTNQPCFQVFERSIPTLVGFKHPSRSLNIVNGTSVTKILVTN